MMKVQGDSEDELPCVIGGEREGDTSDGAHAQTTQFRQTA